MPAKSSSRKSSRKSSGSSRKKSSGRKYGPKAQKSVATEMRHSKQGEHKSRKQAISIGLSKARRAGAKVPAKSSSQSKKAA